MFIKDNVFIIAEVGQNHQGDLDIAREYIQVFSDAGADAVKFQTRNNKYLFSHNAYNAVYNSENAFAEVYGLHREKLELNPEWLPILKKDCENRNVKFISTPFDEPSLDLLDKIGVDAYKVASFDLGNLPFINRIASKKKPIVMSIGGGNHDQIDASVQVILKHTDQLAILHCVSEYPCTAEKLGLNNIEHLIKKYPQCFIGSSDHFNGILSGPIAYMYGARIFEKHVTLNRSWVGTDHSFALEREGFRKFARDIRRVPKMSIPKEQENIGNEPVFQKLGKSLIVNKNIKAGEIIKMDDLSGKIFTNQFLAVRDSNLVIGKALKVDLMKGDKILLKDIENN